MAVHAGFRAVVAIDFGTANSGIAYYMGTEFKGQEHIKTPNLDNQFGRKFSTTLILEKDPPYNPVVYGGNVLDHFDEDNHLLFHNFKMQLRKKGATCQVKADVGEVEVPAITVIAGCLKLFKQDILEIIRSEEGDEDISEFDIKWILTVPAIWDDESKAAMRKAATEAGLIDNIYSELLVLAFEPECAAIDAHIQQANFLQRSVVYVIVDCGGGTIDTTAQAVKQEPPTISLDERHKPTGGSWGSTEIDKNAIQFVKDLIGEHKALDDNSTELFNFLTTVWERAKTSFTTKEDIPSVKLTLIDFLDAIREKHGSLASAVEQYKARHPEHSGMVCDGQTAVRITGEMMEAFYKPILDKIVDHVRGILKQVVTAQYVLLTGGFSNCRLLRNRMSELLKEEMFDDRIRLVTAIQPSLAIVRGATVFGLMPRPIESRRSRVNYGIQVAAPWQASMPHRSKRVFGGKEYITDKYYSLVTEGQTLHVDQEIESVFLPASNDHTHVDFKLFSCPRDGVQYTHDKDCKELAKVRVSGLPRGGRIEDKAIIVKLKFGQTEISAHFKRANGEEEVLPLDFLQHES